MYPTLRDTDNRLHAILVFKIAEIELCFEANYIAIKCNKKVFKKVKWVMII